MEEEIEISGRTADEALQAALHQLGVNRDQVEIVLLKKGRSGVLGMGVEDARIRVRILPKTGPQASDSPVAVAREVLETLMKVMKIEGKVSVIEAMSDEMPVTLNIEGDDLGILIGRRGQTLASLQYVIRLIVAERLKAWTPISVDVGGYKRRRYESLRALALRLAEQIKRGRRLIALEPMPADERRIIHLALVNHPDVMTQSTGEGESRKVTILSRKR